MNDYITCLCCFGKINKYDSKISLKCNHDYHYKCFVSMIEYDNKLSFNKCPTCLKDLEIPFYVMKETHKKNNHSCSICMDKLGYQFNIHETECNHLFHKKCFDQWFILKKNCPLCRQKIIKHKFNRDNIFINEVPEIKTPEPESEDFGRMNIINNLFATDNEVLEPLLPEINISRPPPLERQVAQINEEMPPGNLTRFLEEEMPVRLPTISPSIRNIRTRRRTNIFENLTEPLEIIGNSISSENNNEEGI